MARTCRELVSLSLCRLSCRCRTAFVSPDAPDAHHLNPLRGAAFSGFGPVLSPPPSGLLNRYRALKPYRGFESPSLRQLHRKTQNFTAGPIPLPRRSGLNHPPLCPRLCHPWRAPAPRASGSRDRSPVLGSKHTKRLIACGETPVHTPACVSFWISGADAGCESRAVQIGVPKGIRRAR